MTIQTNSMQQLNLLSTRGVDYQVQGKQLLKGIDMQVQAGEFVAIVGPNGAGKSTLLRILSGELNPSAGKVYWRKQFLNKMSKAELARERAVLSQQHQVSLPFNTDELVMMGRYPHFDQVPTVKDQEIVTAAFDKVDAQALRGRNFLQLSGGEQQRILLAQAFAQIWDRPNGLLLLDEPTNNLDLAHQQHLLQAAHELTQKGYAVVAILHDLNLAMHFADQVILLRQGSIWAQGTPEATLTASNIKMTFDVTVRLIQNVAARPLIVPDFAAAIPVFSDLDAGSSLQT
ncbi:heme ABC transporter ATP-binding protein [Haliscomenobacter sp.]|uniref:heme ABC transporter ATP-binding protein n=1 Tax=Haliscomenobacter sp. TaxID=2717303 RepID=UPI00359491B8